MRVKQTLPSLHMPRKDRGFSGELAGVDSSPSLLFSFFPLLGFHFMMMEPKSIFLPTALSKPKLTDPYSC